ncbi:MAG: hypothetical protein ACLQFR_27540 [Streptosporangiaceae bacterium]
MGVVISLIAVVILGGIVVVARGRGGELARDKVEMPAAMDLRTWSDVAKYRPPAALLGYHAASTEQALVIVARSIAERDAEIAWLRTKLAELQPESAGRGDEINGGAEAHVPAGSNEAHVPAGSNEAVTAEPPVEAGYRPQGGSAGRSSDE